jgi:mitochondrial fission protein ELM1
MRPLIVWRFSDGKAGHDSQSRGLVEALARLIPIDVIQSEVLPPLAALGGIFFGKASAWKGLPSPDLLLGAGHATHLSLLAARRSRGGKAVVLMRPTLPLYLFDLCLIPEHDGIAPRKNVVLTRGALNRIRPSDRQESSQGLLLVGGPSAHFAWDAKALHEHVAGIVAADPAVHWTLATSRRTPPDFLANWPVAPHERLTVVPVEVTAPDWLPAQLARAEQAWVTADSVSMVYEALTAGAAVGVLPMPQHGASRISRGVDDLVAEGWVIPLADWRRDGHLRRPPATFNEAERCARWIVERWFP